MNESFTVPVLQLDGVCDCSCHLINLLVKRSVRYQSDTTHLDQLRSGLTHSLCQRLVITDDIKVSLYE